MQETKKLLGKPIAEEMKSRDAERVSRLEALGVEPMLRVIRVGERPDDLAYEKRIVSAGAGVGVHVSVRTLPDDAGTEALLREIEVANNDSEVHGILMFRPLPSGYDEKAAVDAITYGKDVDGVSEVSMARLYESKTVPKRTGGASDARDAKGAKGAKDAKDAKDVKDARRARDARRFFLPCTAESVLKILEYYDVEIEGKQAVVIGRSVVIGKPAALLLMALNATVTIAHSRTKNLPEICRGADILICAAGMTAKDAEGGQRGGVGKEHLSDKQVVIDVGIHVSEEGALFGDVDKAAADCPAALTPVPGGVGSVTTQILLSHVIDAAEDAAPYNEEADEV